MSNRCCGWLYIAEGDVSKEDQTTKKCRWSVELKLRKAPWDWSYVSLKVLWDQWVKCRCCMECILKIWKLVRLSWTVSWGHFQMVIRWLWQLSTSIYKSSWVPFGHFTSAPHRSSTLAQEISVARIVLHTLQLIPPTSLIGPKWSTPGWNVKNTW